MRVKRGVASHARHKKILKLAKGYRGKRKNVFKLAKNAVMKAGQNAYRDRRLKKRAFHQLWVLRINAACRQHDLRYSRFIYGWELAGMKINRKMLSELATNHPEVFEQIVNEVKAVLPAEGEAPDLEALAKRRSGAKPAAKKAAAKTESKTTEKEGVKEEEKTEEKADKKAEKEEKAEK